MTGCTSTEPRQMDIAKIENRLNCKGNIKKTHSKETITC